MATAPITNDEDVALYCLPPQTITPFLSLSPARGMFRFGDMMSDVSFPLFIHIIPAFIYYVIVLSRG